MTDSLDRILKADARSPLEDAGFTARVMQAIPGPAPRTSPWLKPALVLGSATVGSLLAAMLSPMGTALVDGFGDLMFLRTGSQGAIASLALCGTLLVSAIVLALED